MRACMRVCVRACMCLPRRSGNGGQEATDSFDSEEEENPPLASHCGTKQESVAGYAAVYKQQNMQYATPEGRARVSRGHCVPITHDILICFYSCPIVHPSSLTRLDTRSFTGLQAWL